jgi:hypothetical protein
MKKPNSYLLELNFSRNLLNYNFKIMKITAFTFYIIIEIDSAIQNIIFLLKKNDLYLKNLTIQINLICLFFQTIQLQRAVPYDDRLNIIVFTTEGDIN